MIARKLLRMPSFMKNSIILSQHICITHIANKTERSPFDSYKQLEVEEDKILSQLKFTFPLTINVISTLKSNENDLNGLHFIRALKLFLAHYNNETNRNDKLGIQWHKNCQPELEEIFKVIQKNLRKVSPSEIVEILELLSRMKTPVQYNFVQQILKHINNSVDQLSFRDICKLSMAMEMFPQTELIRNVKTSIKPNFLKRLSHEFNENDIVDIEYALSFINSHFSQDKLYKIFSMKFQNYKGEIPLKNAFSIFKLVCSMKYQSKELLSVLQRLQTTFMNNYHELNENQVLYLINNLLTAVFKERRDKYYDPIFLDNLIKLIVINDMGLSNALNALKSTNKIRHTNSELLNYACASYFEKNNSSPKRTEIHIGQLLILITSLVEAEHKTVFWNDIKNDILNRNLLLECDKNTLGILTLYLILYECYPIKNLEKIFHDFSEDDFRDVQSVRLLINIYQKLKLNPTYEGPLPTELQMRLMKSYVINESRRRKLYSLNNLVEGVGGSEYVKSRVISKLFHEIDHVVVLDNTGSPVPLNNTHDINSAYDVTELEDLKVPSNCKIVTIINTPYFWYFRNKPNMLGRYKNRFYTLEKMGYIPIGVNEGVWNGIADQQKTSFLMNLIKSKVLNKEEKIEI